MSGLAAFRSGGGRRPNRGRCATRELGQLNLITDESCGSGTCAFWGRLPPRLAFGADGPMGMFKSTTPSL